MLWTVRTTGTDRTSRDGTLASAQANSGDLGMQVDDIGSCRRHGPGESAGALDDRDLRRRRGGTPNHPDAPGGQARGHLIAIRVIAGGDDRKERDLVALGGARDGEHLRHALRATESEVCHDVKDAHSGLMGSLVFGDPNGPGGLSADCGHVEATSRRLSRR